MSIPVKLRSLLSNLAAFALGAGLAVTWHLNGDEADPPQVKSISGSERGKTETRNEGFREPAAGADSDEMASATDEESEADAPSSALRLTTSSPMYSPGSPGFAAEQRRNRRLEILELTLRLDLSPDQSAELEAVALRDFESPSDPWAWLLGGRSHEKWLDENLSPAQAASYSRYLLSKQTESAELIALERVHRMASVLELTPEQRFALFSTETRKQLMRSSTTVAITTVPGLRETRNSTAAPPLPEVWEIITGDKASVFLRFLREEEALQNLKARELKEAGVHE